MSDANKNESWGILGCLAAVILVPMQWVQGWGRTKEERDDAKRFDAEMRGRMNAIQAKIDAEKK